MELADALDIGWEMVKQHKSPHVFLWLAEKEDWMSGYEVTATLHDDKHVNLNIREWSTMIMPPSSTLN
jgi:hypothetical protein